VLRAMGASVVAMVLVLVIGPAFIRWLRVNEFGQNIREEGPAGHKAKEGTPTMGGILIWFAVLIPYLVFSRFSVASLTVFIAAIGNAMIGFTDDWIKIVRKRSLGLSARYKLLLQLLLSLFVGFVALHFVGITTAVVVCCAALTRLADRSGAFGDTAVGRGVAALVRTRADLAGWAVWWLVIAAFLWIGLAT